MRIVVMNHVTLDGVIQAPGRADEDPRDGFEHGGWSTPYSDSVMGNVIGSRMARPDGAMLFGRRSYEDLLGYWNSQPDSPFTPALNKGQKFVASSTLRDPLPWPNSTLLEGDVPTAVAGLAEQPGGDLTIMGSGALIRSLMPHDLIESTC